jgi:hypothetical protein
VFVLIVFCAFLVKKTTCAIDLLDRMLDNMQKAERVSGWRAL